MVLILRSLLTWLRWGSWSAPRHAVRGSQDTKPHRFDIEVRADLTRVTMDAVLARITTRTVDPWGSPPSRGENDSWCNWKDVPEGQGCRTCGCRRTCRCGCDHEDEVRVSLTACQPGQCLTTVRRSAFGFFHEDAVADHEAARQARARVQADPGLIVGGFGIVNCSCAPL